jgi:hypothetical protein
MTARRWAFEITPVRGTVDACPREKFFVETRNPDDGDAESIVEEG